MQMIDAHTILRALVGQPIWNMRRSHGSCFLAEFGVVKKIITLPARSLGDGRLTPERRVPVGEWSLLVERCAWQIKVAEDVTSHLDEDHPHMQGVMDKLESQVVVRVVLDEALLTLAFANGSLLELGPAAAMQDRAIADQWVLYRPDGRKVARDTTGGLSLE